MTKKVKRLKVRKLKKELEEEWERIKPILDKVLPELVTRSIREDRDSR